MHNIHVVISDEGSTVIYHPNTDMTGLDLGDEIENRPGLNVWPSGWLKRQVFHILRKVFGRQGTVSDWTRTWTGWGVWTQEGDRVTHLFTPGYAEFIFHSTAVDWEIHYLKALTS